MSELEAAKSAVLAATTKRVLHDTWGVFLQAWLADRSDGRLQTRPGTPDGASFFATDGDLELPVWAPVRDEHAAEKRYPIFDIETRAFAGSPDGMVLAVWLDRPYLRTESSWMRAGWGFLYRQHARTQGLLQANERFRQPLHENVQLWAPHRCNTPHMLCARVTDLLQEAREASRNRGGPD